MITTQEINPLYNVEIEVPNDSFYEFNKDGYVINQIQSLEEDIFESIKACIGYVENSLGDDSMFKIEDGKLGDIAPTILKIMGVDIPKEMTGNILIK